MAGLVFAGLYGLVGECDRWDETAGHQPDSGKLPEHTQGC